MIHEVSPVPHSGGKEEGGKVEEKAVPIPNEFERVKNIVENGKRCE
jgi:hypothetical protein